jgi:hypothetical protein
MRMTVDRDRLKREAWLMVLGGGDYTGLDGCWFALTTQQEVQKLDNGEISAGEVSKPHYSMQALLEWAIDHGYFDETEGK